MNTSNFSSSVMMAPAGQGHLRRRTQRRARKLRRILQTVFSGWHCDRVFPLSFIRWRRGPGKGGASLIPLSSILSPLVPREERKKTRSTLRTFRSRHRRHLVTSNSFPAWLNMKSSFLLPGGCFCFLGLFEPTLMAQANQTNQTTAARWLAKADLASPFTVPKTRRAWEGTRREVRAQLWQLLGKLPPRPRVPTVRTLSREDKGEYLLEKFEFDNLAGATVPGYLLLPKNAAGKSPAILYCHWH